MDGVERQGRSWVYATENQEESRRIAGGEALPAADTGLLMLRKGNVPGLASREA